MSAAGASTPEPAFPGLSCAWVSALAVPPAHDLSPDPESPAHVAATAALAGVLGLDGIAWARQVHGGEVRRAWSPGCIGKADALWTDQPGLGVLGLSADCPIVLVAGRRAAGPPLWGMAHASWRSTIAGIVPRLLAAMAAAGLDSASAQAVVAPSAGPCCYEVGGEVRRAALEALGPRAAAFFPIRRGRLVFDLWAAAREALRGAGLDPGAVRVDGRCTICGRGFPSHRREGERAGRFGVLLGFGR